MEHLDHIGIPLVLAGFVLLVFGRKLFWLLVAAAGFLAGFYFSAHLFADAPQSTFLIAGLVLGIAGGLLTLFAQKLAILVGGFLAGGYVLMVLISGLSGFEGIPLWISFLLGGIAGAFLLKHVFEWTLIVLTSIMGAAMVIGGIGDFNQLSFPLTLVLGVIGIVIQSRFKHRRKH